MNKYPAAAFFDSKRNWIFFLLLFLYQIFFIFQGIDLNDEGAYGAFYQQIFKNPQSVQFNFMYWMSGVIGGTYLHFFHSYGMLALRFAGVLTTTSTICIVYHLLKKYIHTAHLKLGLMITLLLFDREGKDIFYDNITALLFVLMVLFLFRGLERGKPLKLFISGLLLSVNTFVRLPNALGLTLAAAILYYAFIHNLKWQQLLKLLVIYIGGFGLGVLAIIIIMKYAGQYDVFMNSLAVVKEMSKNKENTHNIKSLIFVFLNQYPSSVVYALEFIGVIIMISSVVNKFSDRYPLAGITRVSGYVLFLLFMLLVVKEKFISMGLLVTCITGLCLLACFFLIIKKDNYPLSQLALMGAIMAMIALFGSDTGIEVVGKFTLWIALPLATDYYFSIVAVGIDSTSTFSENKVLHTAYLAFSVTEKQLDQVRKYTVSGIILAFLFFACVYTWNDSFDRTKMRYAINSSYSKGIFTTREKATAINELLAESSKYVQKGDYVLAFDGIALYYPLSQTVPFVRCSWPQLYDKEVFKDQLDKAVAETKILPVVIYQKGNTLYRNWPDSVIDTKDVFIKPHPGETYMKQFLIEKQYRLIWENKGFSIYLPPKKTE